MSNLLDAIDPNFTRLLNRGVIPTIPYSDCVKRKKRKHDIKTVTIRLTRCIRHDDFMLLLHCTLVLFIDAQLCFHTSAPSTRRLVFSLSLFFVSSTSLWFFPVSSWRLFLCIMYTLNNVTWNKIHVVTRV